MGERGYVGGREERDWGERSGIAYFFLFINQVFFRTKPLSWKFSERQIFSDEIFIFLKIKSTIVLPYFSNWIFIINYSNAADRQKSGFYPDFTIIKKYGLVRIFYSLFCYHSSEKIRLCDKNPDETINFTIV